MKVKPRDGLIVPNPNGGGKITGTQEVERTPAAIRMINDGDLIVLHNTSKPVKKSKKCKQVDGDK